MAKWKSPLTITDVCPAFYVSERGNVHTTGVYVTPSDDTNIRAQLLHEICQIEPEKSEDISLVKQPDRWDVCVKGRFTPIGRVYVLAMLDPAWRP